MTASFAVLGHLQWLWIPAAIMLELASMAAFAIMLRGLLAAGGASVGVRPMLATAYAANALSVSVPLAGPELATAFTFRRFTRQGADAPLAGWSLLAGGVVSAAAGTLVLGGGGLASGNILATAVAVPASAVALTVLYLAGAAMRRPQLRDTLERPAAWALRHGSRLLRRPAAESRRTARAWADRLGSLQLSPSGWMTVTAMALANWLADAAVLAVSIRAAGAPRTLARPPAGLRLGNRRAKPQHHARWPRRHRGGARRGPGGHRAAGQPGPGCSAALPPGQFLAGRNRRVAGLSLAAAPPSRRARARVPARTRCFGNRTPL